MKTRKGNAAFTASGHLCHLPKYKGSGLTWRQVFQKNPEYVAWVYKNLRQLRFNTAFQDKIKTYIASSKKQR